MRWPRRADSRSPTSRIRTSFFMSTARRGRARPARMKRTPLAGSAHPAAPLSQRCRHRLPASPAAPPDPRLGPAAPPPRLLPRSGAGTAPAPPPPAPQVAAAARPTGRREGLALSERERFLGLSGAPSVQLAAAQGRAPPTLFPAPGAADTPAAGNLSGRSASLTLFILQNWGRRRYLSKVT